jgi:2,3-bisphosphoglycerate-independent phosphoglycerate mutase
MFLYTDESKWRACMPQEYITRLIQPAETKIILLVLDGLGGLPMVPGGLTELEAANTPNLDKLALEGTLGQTIPIKPGITPGSGPAHLALFGYDPLVHDVGRGALSAAGVGLKVNPGDVAARGNFCTLDSEGRITDRRAGRLPNEESKPVVEILQKVQINGVKIDVRQVKEYRFTVVMRGADLSPALKDTDPQKTGVEPLPVIPTQQNAEYTAKLFNHWIEDARDAIKDQPKANGLTLRGFATDPGLVSYQEAYGLRAACIAAYPMYRGVSRLVGMEVIEFEGEHLEDEITAAKNNWDDYDFFFIHIKKTDSMGEDGNFDGKVNIIESVDRAIPYLLSLQPDVLVVTGDHSTPSLLKSHSWHPVPLLFWTKSTHMPDSQTHFGERSCAQGGLGTIPATDIMPLALGHAGRLAKYGA